jgi:spermidine/putrescine transport system ATP-binding protein
MFTLANMVELKNVTKQFGDFTAVKNMDLNIKHGEFLTLLGPSGCGKTTSLRMIAGFEHVTSGEIRINGEDVSNVEPYNREINTVFQSYALFPHMNVFDNVAFGLKMKKVNKKDIKKQVNDVLELVRLGEYERRNIKQLSGGQKQRIAIARAIVNNPKVLLLDEPLGALDLKLRKQMQLELKKLQKELGITFIYVTHDQEEALTMSDRIVVMNQGKIEQVGAPEEIYKKPSTEFVADFIGETNILKAVVKDIKGNKAQLDINGKDFLIPKTNNILSNNKVHIAIRPEKVMISIEPLKESFNFTGIIKQTIYIGTTTKIVIALNDGQEIVVNDNYNILDKVSGDENLYINWNIDDCVIFTSNDYVMN